MMDHGQRHLLGLDLKESGTFLCLMWTKENRFDRDMVFLPVSLQEIQEDSSRIQENTQPPATTSPSSARQEESWRSRCFWRRPTLWWNLYKCMTNRPEEAQGPGGDHLRRHLHWCNDWSLRKCGDVCCIKEASQPSMQGGHWCRRKCDAPLSLWKTLPQSFNKSWTAHRTMKMQHKAQSLQWNQHTTAWCPGYNNLLEGWGN